MVVGAGKPRTQRGECNRSDRYGKFFKFLSTIKTYTATAAISGTGFSTLNISVSFTIYDGSDATISAPGPFSQTAGTKSSYTALLQVDNGTGGYLNNPIQSLNNSGGLTASGGSWLSVATTGAASTFRITVDATNLSAGEYAGTVTVNGTVSTGDLPFSVDYAVLLTVTSALPPAPVVTSGTANGTAGSAFSYQIAATNAPTSYGATGLPSGLTLNGTTGSITGTPTAAGTSTVTLSATNSSGTGTGTLTLTIVPPAPVVTSGTANGTIGTAFSYQIAATNTPTSYGATGLPAGLTLNGTTGSISGTPAAAGTSTVTLSATNSGGTGTGTLTLTIVPPAPVVTSGTANGTVGSAFSYQIAATNTPTSYGATGLPAGLTLNGTTGSISGTPAAAGTSTVTLSATNSRGTGTGTLTLTIVSGVVISASPFSLSFAAYLSRGAPPAQTITISSSNGSAVSFTVAGVPSWLQASALSGVTGQNSGTLALIPVTTGLAAGNSSATLTITPGNSSPAVSVGVALSVAPFSITASPSPLNISVVSGQTQTAALAIGTVDSGAASLNAAATGSTALTVAASPIAAPASVNVSVNAAALAPGSYSGTIGLTCVAPASCAAVNVPVNITVTSGPLQPTISVNGIRPIYSAATTIQSGEWVWMFGANFVANAAIWNGQFPIPTSLGNVTVTIDGKNALLWYVGPGQINLQVPDDANSGTVPVVVTTPNGTATETVTLGQFGPSFSLLGDLKHVAAEIFPSYEILGPTGTSLGYPTVAAKSGDTVLLFGVGFGPTNPVVPAGQPPPGGSAPALNMPVITIGGVTANVLYTGLVAAGLFQINITVPNGVASGDQPLMAQVGGVQTPTGVVFAIQ